MKNRIRKLLPVIAAGIGGGLLCRLLAVLTVRHLAEVLTFLIEAFLPDADVGEVLSRIFVASVKKWLIGSRLLYPSLICFAAAWIVWAAFRPRSEAASSGGGRRIRIVLCRVAAVFAAVILFLAAYLVALWLGEVNGIRFGDVILSLITLIRSGALDSLSSGPAAVLPEVL